MSRSSSASRAGSSSSEYLTSPAQAIATLAAATGGNPLYNIEGRYIGPDYLVPHIEHLRGGEFTPLPPTHPPGFHSPKPSELRWPSNPLSSSSSSSSSSSNQSPHVNDPFGDAQISALHRIVANSGAAEPPGRPLRSTADYSLGRPEFNPKFAGHGLNSSERALIRNLEGRNTRFNPLLHLEDTRSRVPDMYNNLDPRLYGIGAQGTSRIGPSGKRYWDGGDLWINEEDDPPVQSTKGIGGFRPSSSTNSNFNLEPNPFTSLQGPKHTSANPSLSHLLASMRF